MGKQRKRNARYFDHGPLTPENVKTFEGFEEVSDEEALEIFLCIDTLCRITVDYLQGLNRKQQCENEMRLK